MGDRKITVVRNERQPNGKGRLRVRSIRLRAWDNWDIGEDHFGWKERKGVLTGKKNSGK